MLLLELIIGNLLLAMLIASIALWVGRGGKHASLAHALWVLVFVKLITPPIISFPVPVPIPTMASQVATQEKKLTASLDGQHIWRGSPAGNDSVTQDTEISVSSDRSPAPVDTSDLAVDHVQNDASVIDRISSVTPAPSTLLEQVTRFIDQGMVWFVAVWAIGFLVLSIRGLVRLVRFRRLIQECGQDDEEAAAIVRQFACQRLRSRPGARSPRVVRLNVHVSPMLFGFATRPIIVCPEALWQAMSEDDRRAFLAHETAHYCRRDHWVRWLEWLVSSAYWWFPGIYFAQSQLERHEEACCDARAVELLETKPRRYAEALLRVVDFISDYQVGLPSFASGMQPTATLEERLRLLMLPDKAGPTSRTLRTASGAMCSAMILIHPQLYPIAWQDERSPEDQWVIAKSSFDQSIERAPAIEFQPTNPDLELPPEPVGFWNLEPARRWASFRLKTSGYRLRAVTGRGISIERDRRRLMFKQEELTSISEVASTGRVIIGDREGNVRLWDLDAGMAVSLLGNHRHEVTSVCVGVEGGVFSADHAGSVIRWEMQSGQMIARWTANDRPIQSIRISSDDNFVAVVCGDWKSLRVAPTLHLLEAQTLTEKGRQPLPEDTALVRQADDGQWCVISWDGTVRDLFTETVIGSVDKVQVSSLLLSQHATFDLPPNDLIGQQMALPSE
ncbi:M56 family metallopeptidase [Roseiconus lacunae]|uniref:M56 family metallopeptidase n=1 Tax=Roseiconus lacunae TaxID=2605694 RepID=UPI0011F12B9A|nr:M56 family metallopeptidase [Roseiconus lacunae]